MYSIFLKVMVVIGSDGLDIEVEAFSAVYFPLVSFIPLQSFESCFIDVIGVLGHLMFAQVLFIAVDKSRL